ncbi:MAG: phenylacetate--CoA ligase [Mailhella sp.]|nr:phenylacetate--CoA ligase [Mailhella sp.]
MDYFDIAETWSRDQIAGEQAKRLRSAIQRAQRSPFYAKRFAEAGITPDSIRTVDDIRKVPFTSKDDLRRCYPYGLACVDRSEFVRMHCSSGTTGSPVAICYTQKDLDTWAGLMARGMHVAGFRKEDVFQNMSGYGLFTGGLGIHYGAERLGMMTIPAGAGNTRRQIKLLKDFGVTGIHILPSYAMHVAEQVRAMGEDPRKLPLRKALVGAEPYTEETRRRIEDMLDIKVYNNFGMSEMNGPGVGIECEAQAGMHIWEDSYILEIIDPDTEKLLPDGEIGELVLTNLTREGMPIIRYRTHDMTRIIPGECPCGRKHRRIDRILGRSDDMFILKGVNIYPMQIEQVLMSMPEVGQNYLIRLESDGSRDTMRVLVEMREKDLVDDIRRLKALQERIAHRLFDEILVTPIVELVHANSLPVAEGKAKRLVDLRGEDRGA